MYKQISIFKGISIIVVASMMQLYGNAQVSGGKVIFRFKNMANNQTLVLLDSAYTNAFNESYQVTKLKYHISNINLTDKENDPISKNIFLLDASSADSIVIKLKPGTYTNLSFMLGVDSALNCSGAQSGALDPLNGMFWTWNSGYVYFKMEGYSTSSTADLQRIEHHIGGYKGLNNAARNIELLLNAPLIVKEKAVHEIVLKVDLDKYWQGKQSIKIADNALIMSPGVLAKKSADNFAGMFSILDIK